MQILTAALKPTHREAGLYLEEGRRGVVYLMHDNEALADWPGRELTIDKLWKEADAFVANTIMLAAEDYWKHQRCLAH